MIFKLEVARHIIEYGAFADGLVKLGFSLEYLSGNEVRVTGKPEIEINTLEELVSLVKDQGGVVVLEDEYIEIYNGYRE